VPLVAPPDLDVIDPDLRADYEAGRARHAHFDSLRRLLLLFPPAIRAADGMYDLMMGPGVLSRSMKEQVFVACSAVRGCEYATLAHGDWLMEHTDLTRAEVDLLIRGDDLSRHNELERGVLAFSRKVSAAPYRTIPADIEALRSVGLEERGIVETLAVVSLSGWMNGYAQSLGLNTTTG
jgi:uncharacterized peroxidase-related enzyme